LHKLRKTGEFSDKGTKISQFFFLGIYLLASTSIKSRVKSSFASAALNKRKTNTLHKQKKKKKKEKKKKKKKKKITLGIFDDFLFSLHQHQPTPAPTTHSTPTRLCKASDVVYKGHI
jgi:hypothetical protein